MNGSNGYVLPIGRQMMSGRRIMHGFIIMAAAISAAHAQRAPEIGYVYPAGAQAGSTVELALAGRFLDGTSGAVVSGGGVSVSVVKHIKPLNGREINLLRDQLKDLQEQISPVQSNEEEAAYAAPSGSGEPIDREAIQKEMAEIRTKLANPKNRNRENPQLAEDLVLRITVAPDAAAGRRELRVRTSAGLSNPVVFHVGNLPEYNEKEPNEKAAETELLGPLPLVINGQIKPGDIDRFRIRLTAGMDLVVRAQARDLIPYLADGVPGWFQATLGLYCPDGKEAAYVDDYKFHPDPVIAYKAAADGEYVLEIKDSIYRGREDFVYRITAGELPFITSIFPLGGRAGAETSVRIKGWNLPRNELTINAREHSSGILPVYVGKEQLVSNVMPFAVGPFPECVAEEPNSTLRQGQPVTLPITVNGRIEQPEDSDVFRFEGRAGDAIVAEVYARRLDSPLDSILRLTDAQGRVIAANDDHEDKGAGLITHHADSLINATLPADGDYYLHIADAQRKGGPDYGYRLRIGGPQPDFDLRVAPSTVNVRAGSTANITVHAIRRDGFTGPITVSLKNAPQGFTLNGGLIPADKEEVRMQLRAPGKALNEPVVLNFEGAASIDGQQVVRRVVPADSRMQAFFYWHLVSAEEFKVSVLGRAAAKPLADAAMAPTRNAPPPANASVAVKSSPTKPKSSKPAVAN